MINRKQILSRAIDNGFEHTAEGYPVITEYAKAGCAIDYTIHGNIPQGVNLFDGVFEMGHSNNSTSMSKSRARSTNLIPVTTEPIYKLKILNADGFEVVINIANSSYPFTALSYDSGWQTYSQTFKARKDGYLCIMLRKPDNSNFTLADTANVKLVLYTVSKSELSGGENLLNYEDKFAITGNMKADGNGWYTVDIDATGIESGVYWNRCWTPPNPNLKPSTDYYVYIEIAEQSGSGYNRIWNNPGNGYMPQFLAWSDNATATGESGVIITKTLTTKDDFTGCLNMMTTEFTVAAGHTFHIKFRMAVYETKKDVFVPYIEKGVGDKTKNLFNYTEAKSAAATADADGWFDVTIDNSAGTTTKYINAWTKVDKSLKTDTPYNILLQISELSGDIGVYAVSYDDSSLSQFKNTSQKRTSAGIYTEVISTRTSFDDSITMLRTFCSCAAGKSGRVRFRIAVYETACSEFEPYNKYKIPILNGTDEAAVIYLDKPLGIGESINYTADNLPELAVNNNVNTLKTGTATTPEKMSVKYITRVKGD